MKSAEAGPMTSATRNVTTASLAPAASGDSSPQRTSKAAVAADRTAQLPRILDRILCL